MPIRRQGKERKRKTRQSLTLLDFLTPRDADVQPLVRSASEPKSSETEGEECRPKEPLLSPTKRATTPRRRGVKSEDGGGDVDDVTAQKLRLLKLDEGIFSVDKSIKRQRQNDCPQRNCAECIEVMTVVKEEKEKSETTEPDVEEENVGKSVVQRGGVHRCVVTKLMDSALQPRCRVVNASLCENQEDIVVELCDGWRQTRVEVGDVIHLIATLTEQDGVWHARIDHEDGFLILFPDILISGSQVPVGSNCMRRAYLAERIIDRRPTHHSAVMGNIMHKIMQDSLQKYVPYKGQMLDLGKEISEVIDASSLSLFECGKTEADAREFINARMKHIHEWLKHFAAVDC